MSSLMPVAAEALEKSTLTLQQIGFTCSGSSDHLAGAPFSFVMAVDALGAWPPISDSHLERRMTPLRDRSRRGHEMTLGRPVERVPSSFPGFIVDLGDYPIAID